jgi:integrase/recombinase XerD
MTAAIASTSEPIAPAHTSLGARTTSGDASDRFLDHCRVAKCLSLHTLRAYRADLADFRRQIGDGTAIGEIDRDTVRDYARFLLDTKRLTAATVKRRMATLKVLFRWLEREEVVPFSIFHNLDLSIRLPRRLPRALDADDVRRLLRTTQAMAERGRSERPYEAILMHFVVVVLCATGLRIGELLAARLGDVSTEESAVQVRGKGDRERRVYVPGAEANAVLKRFLEARKTINAGRDELLLNVDGTPLKAHSLRMRLNTLVTRAGISRHITPHMLRHTAATQLLEAGVDIRLVQRLLGHASISTTQIYARVTDRTLRDRLNQANTLRRFLCKGHDN